MPVFLIIPTYNERENIEPLLVAIRSLAVPDLRVLIVDDCSPDGTGAFADSLRERFAWLTVLHREKKDGLGSAYRAGFAYVLDHGAEFVMEMDADFSHPPAMIPQLLAAAQNADLVIGSRYAQGGKIENWNLARRMISRFGNWYAQFVLRVPVNDMTAGFKCFRASALRSINALSSASLGYHFQIELTYLAVRKGLRVQELPITFTERRLGRSKFHLRIVLESMIGVWKLKRGHGTRDKGQKETQQEF